MGGDVNLIVRTIEQLSTGRVGYPQIIGSYPQVYNKTINSECFSFTQMWGCLFLEGLHAVFDRDLLQNFFQPVQEGVQRLQTFGQRRRA